MAQRKDDNQPTLQHVLSLASQLSADEREQLIEQLKLQWLREELNEADAEAESLTVEEVNAAIDEIRRKRQT